MSCLKLFYLLALFCRIVSFITQNEAQTIVEAQGLV